jgi:hypothetical protein
MDHGSSPRLYETRSRSMSSTSPPKLKSFGCAHAHSKRAINQAQYGQSSGNQSSGRNSNNSSGGSYAGVRRWRAHFSRPPTQNADAPHTYGAVHATHPTQTQAPCPVSEPPWVRRRVCGLCDLQVGGSGSSLPVVLFELNPGAGARSRSEAGRCCTSGPSGRPAIRRRGGRPRLVR